MQKFLEILQATYVKSERDPTIIISYIKMKFVVLRSIFRRCVSGN